MTKKTNITPSLLLIALVLAATLLLGSGDATSFGVLDDDAIAEETGMSESFKFVMIIIVIILIVGIYALRKK